MRSLISLVGLFCFIFNVWGQSNDLTQDGRDKLPGDFTIGIQYKDFLGRLMLNREIKDIKNFYANAVKQLSFAKSEEEIKEFCSAADEYGMCARDLEWVYRTVKNCKISDFEISTIDIELNDAQLGEVESILSMLDGILTETQKKTFLNEWNWLKEKYMSMSYTDYMRTKYHDFTHAMDDVRIVAQGIAALKAKGDSIESKNAFKAILAALYHDAGYTVPGIKTSNHVEESVIIAKAQLEKIQHKDPNLFLQQSDIKDILMMIASTSITNIENEKQWKVKKLREEMNDKGFSNKSLGYINNFLTLADLTGAAMTKAYTRNLIPLYREYYDSVKGDAFGSGLQLMYGSGNFQEKFAKAVVIKNALRADSSEKVNQFVNSVFTKKQLARYAEYLETIQIFYEVGRKLEKCESIDKQIAEIRKRQDFFEANDSLKILVMLDILNRMVKKESLSIKDKESLDELKLDPAFELEASTVLLYGLIQEYWQVEKLEEITELYTRFEILRKRNANLNNAVYGIDYKNAFTVFKENDPEKINKFIEYIAIEKLP